MASLADYKDREQAYVKHTFLESYLERLIHKTASSYPHIVYVDGFAGPWQSTNQTLQDTSFGIALNALRKAKASWKAIGRDVAMTALLVEQNARGIIRLTYHGIGRLDQCRQTRQPCVWRTGRYFFFLPRPLMRAAPLIIGGHSITLFQKKSR